MSGLSIRKKLALILLTAAVIPLIVAGATLSVLILRFHEDASRERFEAFFVAFEQELRLRSTDAERAADVLRARPGFIAELSLLSRYLDPANYEPLVFAPVSRNLAALVQEQIRGAGLDRAFLYDAHGRLVTAQCETAGLPALYVSYKNAVPYLQPVDELQAESFEGRLPTIDRNPELFVRSFSGEYQYGSHISHVEDSLLIVLDFPVERQSFDGTMSVVGTLRIGARADFGGGVAAGVRDFPAVGVYQPGLSSSLSFQYLREQLDKVGPVEYSLKHPAFFQDASYYYAAVPIILQGADEIAWLYAMINRDLVRREARGTMLVILFILAISIALIIPIAFFLEERYFGGPAKELMRGVAAVRAGDYGARVQISSDDEMSLLAESINEMAATIQDYTGGLEEMVQERTREIEAANKAKSRFLARVTHEIRNPMNGVMGMAQLLQSGTLDDEQKEYVNVILSSSQHLLNIVNDILDISKIEAGKLELQAAPFRPAELIQGVVELFRPQMNSKGVVPSVIVAPEVPELLIGDEGRLRQVLANLVSNAAKFTDSGTITVQVTRADSSLIDVGSGTRLLFTVSDTGVGIDPDRIEEMFADYTQVYGRDGRSTQGTGLGLPIVKELVELMQGSISVESTPGSGSVFRFDAVFCNGIDLSQGEHGEDKG